MFDDKTIRLVNDYKETFESPHGKRVLADLTSRSTQRRIEISSPFDPYKLAYDEGRRSVIVYILSRIETDLMKERPEEAIGE